jgi:hypothetical protein
MDGPITARGEARRIIHRNTTFAFPVICTLLAEFFMFSFRLSAQVACQDGRTIYETGYINKWRKSFGCDQDDISLFGEARPNRIKMCVALNAVKPLIVNGSVGRESF